MSRPVVLSRHRLPRPYRLLMPALVLCPALIFTLAIVIGRGPSLALLDPRYWLPLSIALLPALYWWREGIDVRTDGLFRRMHLPRFFAYSECSDWALKSREGVLIVYDRQGDKAIECRAHLTDFGLLVNAVRAGIRPPSA